MPLHEARPPSWVPVGRDMIAEPEDLEPQDLSPADRLHDLAADLIRVVRRLEEMADYLELVEVAETGSTPKG